ncbi:hypothetical protein [Lacisediminihabitans profunda]|uniref:Uncharacterized protein n=1 Tax=Lacisediminihabitans profunda TaxID=2594790 RepID=A0A5C8UTV4_9MICO|nr:hypothetical protein [Lacisediminihabitans profunda]TXN32053.1 hypothetical protein FVP33_03785 [Lacisediminihabitans profunda]
MTQNQSNSVFNTPLKKRIAVGAASVLTAGALLGVGVAGASASPLTPTASASALVHADGHHGHAFGATVAKQIREAFFQSTVDGAKAQKLAVFAVGKTELLAKLPAALQTDLGTLAKAPAADATKDAEKISTTALAGGYGQEVKSVATNLKSGAKHPFAGSLRDELRSDLAQGQDLGQSAEKVATTLIGHPDLFAQLPANLQSDLTAIKNAPASEAGADATKAQATALSGGYGAQIQKIAERLQGAAAGK